MIVNFLKLSYYNCYVRVLLYSNKNANENIAFRVLFRFFFSSCQQLPEALSVVTGEMGLGFAFFACVQIEFLRFELPSVTKTISISVEFVVSDQNKKNYSDTARKERKMVENHLVYRNAQITTFNGPHQSSPIIYLLFGTKLSNALNGVIIGRFKSFRLSFFNCCRCCLLFFSTRSVVLCVCVYCVLWRIARCDKLISDI